MTSGCRSWHRQQQTAVWKMPPGNWPAWVRSRDDLFEFSSFWFHRCQVKISVDVRVDPGGRQETPPSEWRTASMEFQSCRGNFKDVRLYPIFNFGHFLAALLKISGFYPTRKFRQFWADPTFSAVRSIFLAEEEAQILEFYPTRNFCHFLALKDVRFYPNRNFGYFWAPRIFTTLEHLNI